MKVLSIKQPWLYAITDLDKRVENRTWAPPTRLIGQRIALHASATEDSEGRSVIFKIAGVIVPALLPHRCIIATAKLVGWLQKDGDQGIVPDPCLAHLIDDDKWFFGPIGWILDDVVKFETPVSCAGMLGLWDWRGVNE